MKNLIFTAFAVVFFSSVMSAKTFIPKKEIKFKVAFGLQNKPCYEKAMNAVDLAGEDDDVFNNALYQYVLSHC